MSPSRRCGFTLVEFLLTIVLIGVVLSIVLPALAASRLRAIETACVAAIGQAGGVTFAAAAERDDRFRAAPYASGSLGSGGPRAWFGLPGASASVGIDYFAQVRSWPLLIAVDGPTPGLSCAGLDEARRTIRPALTANTAAFGQVTTFEASETVISRHRLWAEWPVVGEAAFAPPPLSSAVFPSSKVMLFERMTHHRRGPPVEFIAEAAPAFPVVFLDGSSRLTTLNKQVLGLPHPVVEDVRRPLAHTLDGIRGRDAASLDR